MFLFFLLFRWKKQMIFCTFLCFARLARSLAFLFYSHACTFNFKSNSNLCWFFIRFRYLLACVLCCVRLLFFHSFVNCNKSTCTFEKPRNRSEKGSKSGKNEKEKKERKTYVWLSIGDDRWFSVFVSLFVRLSVFSMRSWAVCLSHVRERELHRIMLNLISD